MGDAGRAMKRGLTATPLAAELAPDMSRAWKLKYNWEGLDSGKEQSERDECLTTAKDFIHLKKIIISLRNIIWELNFQKIT